MNGRFSTVDQMMLLNVEAQRLCFIISMRASPLSIYQLHLSVQRDNLCLSRFVGDIIALLQQCSFVHSLAMRLQQRRKAKNKKSEGLTVTCLVMYVASTQHSTRVFLIWGKSRHPNIQLFMVGEAL